MKELTNILIFHNYNLPKVPQHDKQNITKVEPKPQLNKTHKLKYQEWTKK